MSTRIGVKINGLKLLSTIVAKRHTKRKLKLLATRSVYV